MAKITKILNKETGVEYEIADAGARSGAFIANGAITPEKTSFGNILHKTSSNLYNSAGQTDDTIEPHYYVNGVPYSTTQFDNSYNCTAPIAVESETSYWLGLIPAVSGYTTPWGEAAQAIFFYDADGNYLSGAAANAFTTPANTAYLRFNYALCNGITLFALNGACMLVKGETAPEEYEKYYDYFLDTQIAFLNERVDLLSKSVYYHIDGDVLDVIYRYSGTQDIRVQMKKKGGNNLFDFYEFALIENHGGGISADHNGGTIVTVTPSDWHAPFIMAAKNNIDGDATTSGHFTGGNHEYTNTGLGGTPTARTATLKFFADGRQVSDTEGYCERLEIIWTNYVQAYNTKKENGSGREVLEERHHITFDGERFRSEVELIPTEDISVICWYGFQCITTDIWAGTVRYIGGANRERYDTTVFSTCANKTATGLVLEKDGHVLEMKLDPTVDIGDRSLYSGTDAVFTESYGKAYMNVIAGGQLTANSVYTLSGSYRFYSI